MTKIKPSCLQHLTILILILISGTVTSQSQDKEFLFYDLGDKLEYYSVSEDTMITLLEQKNLLKFHITGDKVFYFNNVNSTGDLMRLKQGTLKYSNNLITVDNISTIDSADNMIWHLVSDSLFIVRKIGADVLDSSLCTLYSVTNNVLNKFWLPKITSVIGSISNSELLIEVVDQLRAIDVFTGEITRIECFDTLKVTSTVYKSVSGSLDELWEVLKNPRITKISNNTIWSTITVEGYPYPDMHKDNDKIIRVIDKDATSPAFQIYSIPEAKYSSYQSDITICEGCYAARIRDFTGDKILLTVRNNFVPSYYVYEVSLPDATSKFICKINNIRTRNFQLYRISVSE